MDQLKREVKKKHTQNKNDLISSVNGTEAEKSHFLVLHASIKGKKIVKSMNKFHQKYYQQR